MSQATQTARVLSLRDETTRERDGQGRNGLSRWEFEPMTPDRRQNSAVVVQWEQENRPLWRTAIDRSWNKARRAAQFVALLGFTFALGFAVASGPDSAAYNVRLRERLNASNNALSAREGELELTRMEMDRLNTVITNSARYRIPADLAAKIYDIALAEGIDPKIAYSLVRVESEFTHRAISPKGALGLTQLMPATARFFEPKLERSDLFDPETNLRIGFRFLKELIAKYHGDVDLALHAYNRGPEVVDKVVRRGGDPANGYADAVIRGAQ